MRNTENSAYAPPDRHSLHFCHLHQSPRIWLEHEGAAKVLLKKSKEVNQAESELSLERSTMIVARSSSKMLPTLTMRGGFDALSSLGWFLLRSGLQAGSLPRGDALCRARHVFFSRVSHPSTCPLAFGSALQVWHRKQGIHNPAGSTCPKSTPMAEPFKLRGSNCPVPSGELLRVTI